MAFESHTATLDLAAPLVPVAVLLLDVERLCSCAATVEVSGMGLSLAIPGLPLTTEQPTDAATLPDWQACCRQLAQVFLASGAHSLLLQPAGACTTPLLLSTCGRSVPDDSHMLAAVAQAYIDAAGNYAAAAATWPGSWRTSRYSAAPNPNQVAAARVDAARRGGTAVQQRRRDFLHFMKSSLTRDQLAQMKVLEVRQALCPVLSAGWRKQAPQTHPEQPASPPPDAGWQAVDAACRSGERSPGEAPSRGAAMPGRGDSLSSEATDLTTAS